YNWRGNVRELENVMERALLLCDGKEILPHHLMMGQVSMPTLAAVTGKGKAKGKGKEQAAPAEPPAAASGNGALGISVGMSMREVEKKLIFETLRKVEGNRTKAAKLLSISIRTLRNKLNEYADDGEQFDVDVQD
ncbi:MAG: sigma-54-dependent Fis family transcriptional regulator, partial [Candidatus Lambdaproteobacteria bacterium]|nr:sigma-54-dependent Fis family transcriptional regulator [Candidatus Lambdaproteobacteria bacterium]